MGYATTQEPHRSQYSTRNLRNRHYGQRYAHYPSGWISGTCLMPGEHSDITLITPGSSSLFLLLSVIHTNPGCATTFYLLDLLACCVKNSHKSVTRRSLFSRMSPTRATDGLRPGPSATLPRFATAKAACRRACPCVRHPGQALPSSARATSFSTAVALSSVLLV